MPGAQQILKACEGCGREVAGHYKTRFCEECHMVPCAHCGTRHFQPAERIQRSEHYCSRKCANVDTIGRIVRRIEREFGRPLREVLDGLYNGQHLKADEINVRLSICKAGTTLTKLMNMAGLSKRSASESVAMQWHEERRRAQGQATSDRMQTQLAAGWKPSVMSEQQRLKMSVERRGTGNPMHGRTGRNHPGFGRVRHGKTGRRPDLGLVVRSGWEANILRLLSLKGVRWQYEPKAFPVILPDGRESCYIPDILVGNTFIEVKGYWRPDAKEKFEAFREQYPDVRIIVIGAERYAVLYDRWKKVVANWEVKRNAVRKRRAA